MHEVEMVTINILRPKQGILHEIDFSALLWPDRSTRGSIISSSHAWPPAGTADYRS